MRQNIKKMRHGVYRRYRQGETSGAIADSTLAIKTPRLNGYRSWGIVAFIILARLFLFWRVFFLFWRIFFLFWRDFFRFPPDLLLSFFASTICPN